MPTTLAFTTSIISTNISRSKCKKYVAIFSLSTPLSALLTYIVSSFLGNGDKGDLTGLALLVSVRYPFYVSLISRHLVFVMHPGRYIFVCLHRTPASVTSFACGWRDASSDTRVYYCLRNVYSSCTQSAIQSWPLNCAIVSVTKNFVFLRCYYIQKMSSPTISS